MSKFSGKCNELSQDSISLMHQQKKYYFDALDRASELLLDIMQREVLKTVWGDGPGKPEWRRNLSSNLQIVYHEAVDNYISCGVGVPNLSSLGDLAKAMVVTYGAGSAAGNAPISAGPTGRMVWDENQDEQVPSKAKTEYLLPEKFNQAGNHFIENSIQLMKKHFNDVLEEANKNLPDKMFYMNVIVKPR